MNWRAESNPYYGADFQSLERACTQFAIALEDRNPKTPEERRRLASDIRLLLIALAAQFGTGNTVPGSPEMTLSRAEKPEVVREFLAHHQKMMAEDARRRRAKTLRRAADFVLGKEANQWLDLGSVLWSDRPIYYGTQSDEALEKALLELQAMHRPSPK